MQHEMQHGDDTILSLLKLYHIKIWLTLSPKKHMIRAAKESDLVPCLRKPQRGQSLGFFGLAVFIVPV